MYRRDFDETKYMPILIKDELLEKYNEIWKEFKNSIIREFGNEPVIVGHTPSPPPPPPRPPPFLGLPLSRNPRCPHFS